MAAAPKKRSNKEEEEEDLISIEEVAKETKSFIDSVLGDVGKSSAAKQLVIGSISGWCTGFITMKVGKVAAMAVGGGIILLQVANHQGYININWDKVYKQVDKVEEKATGRGQKWMDKVERCVDRKLDKAEELLSRQERRVRSWYSTYILGEEPLQLKEIHIFLVAFAAGVAIGIASG
ncbi:hypothetical protein L9F63_021103 [Diploptera punctata]|uniref:FUN14 domain-containing protein 1 n=1 Tax=Diploptera punctata TaxID=6984 RepID=A0AAD8EBP3_DIPPU|nr:hypothetical protein L9F63_021103 [Diploptera punctata]